MKFKILPEVHAMRIKGRRYMAGSVVDLPESYRGTTFLQEIIAAPAVNVMAAPAQEGSTESQGETRAPSKRRTRRAKQ
jgi:hypothetical protein